MSYSNPPNWSEVFQQLLSRYDIEIINGSYANDIVTIVLASSGELITIELNKYDELKPFFLRTKRFSLIHKAKRLTERQEHVVRLFTVILKKLEDRIPAEMMRSVFTFPNRTINDTGNFYFCTTEKSIDEAGKGSVEAMVRLTSKCNQKCPFCSGEKFLKDPEFKEIKECLDGLLSEYNNLTITITGGEPTLSPHFLKTVSYLASNNKVSDIQIQTNAVSFANKYLIDLLPDSEKIRFFLSFHATRENIYNNCTGTRGQFEKALEGIKNLIALGRKIFLNCVISSINIEYLDSYLDDLVTLFGENNIPEIHFSTLICSEYNSQAPEFLVGYPEVAAKLKKIHTIASERGVSLSPFQSSTHASIPYCFIDDNKLREGNTKYFDIDHREISYEENDKRWVKSPECRKCKYVNACMGLPRQYVDRFGLSEINPIKDTQ